jgi:hypothetical protein
MRRYNSLSSEERDRLEQVFPEFAHSSIDDIVKRFRSRAEAEGFKDLMEGIKRKNRNDEGYGSYLEEIMNELQHIKKEYGSRRKEGYRYRKEASKIQDAYSEIRKLKKDYDNYEDSNKKFNRDSVREFFDKFK